MSAVVGSDRVAAASTPSWEGGALPARDLTRYLPAAYLTSVWVAAKYGISAAGYTDIPFYLLFVAVMFFYIPRKCVFYSIRLALVLVAYEGLKYLQPGFQPATAKAAAGIAAFSLIIAVTYGALEMLRDYSNRELARWLRSVLWLVLLGIFFDYFLYLIGAGIDVEYTSYFVRSLPRFAGLFTEPSILAVAMSPFIFMCIYDYKFFVEHVGVGAVVLLVLIGLLCPSATFVAVCILAGGATVLARIGRGKVLSGLVVVGGVAVLMYVMLSVPVLASRVYGVLYAEDAANLASQNASSLAFLKGFNMASYAAVHLPLGVSFQDMEVLAPHSPVSLISDAWFYHNSTDGSSLLFKGVSEMGLLFELFAGAGIILVIRRMALRAYRTLFEFLILAFQFCIYAYFIRGASYFVGAEPIGLAALIFGLIFDPTFGRWWPKIDPMPDRPGRFGRYVPSPEGKRNR
ncbi:MAG: hypothetical protein KGO02_02705 [Alphaproteobacteria bacterium]|nr:hypothetical protein [Alphaproteobacteria bacterium]